MEEKKEKISFCIYDFMHGFELNKSELGVYAFIYSFRKSEAGLYFGKKTFLAEKCGMSRRTVYRAISSLMEKGLIEEVTLGAHKGLRCAEQHIPKGTDESADENARSLKKEKFIKPKYEIIELGKGYFSISREQYNALLRLVPIETLENYIIRMDRMLEGNMGSGVHAPHSPYRTIKKWIIEDFST